MPQIRLELCVKRWLMCGCANQRRPAQRRTTTANARRTNDRHDEVGDDLRIIKTTRRAAGAGTWVIGTLSGHRFEALVFAEHAECPDYELGTSRISKLWLRRLADKACVANFDRGWDIRPATKTAGAIVDFLAAGLADLICRT